MAKKKNKNKNKNKTADLQLGSPFMQRLPPELRVEIYSQLFFSTRLAWGERALGRISRQRIAHAPNALALLRTCRRVHVEVNTTWLQQVLFSFESPDAMLDKLANIPTETRELIRHARVSGDPLMLSWEEDDVYYRTSQALKLLPGLALDRLTVLGPRGREVCYETLDMLVRHGAGWRELYYLSHDSTFLAYEHDWFAAVGAPDEHRYLRVPQPAGWQRVIDTRDGPASGASVTIYRATAPRRPGAVPDPATRTAFRQTLPTGHDLFTFGKVEDSALMAPGERDKEVLVVVKRGRGVDYAEKKLEGSAYLDDGDIREAMPGMTWKQIKAEQAKLFHDDDDEPFSEDEEEEEPGVVDDYIQVDEYVWPPLHFSAE
ncbi:hypothetical protein C8R44DRAFT_781311 [Mycena epipterygia]|nr:hypothetical protein C8R44DRAFT_781311 [Mycena epipterygia]